MAYGIPLGGQRIVVADRASKVTGREIVIPGLRGHPDALPASPSPWDIEFDLPIGGKMSVLGSGISVSQATIKNHVVLTAAQTGGGSFQWYGLKTTSLPPFPFRVWTKIAGWDGVCNAGSGSNWAGLLIGVTTPGAMSSIGPFGISSTIAPEIYAWSSPTGATGAIYGGPASNGYGLSGEMWIAADVTSSTVVQAYISLSGYESEYIPLGGTFNPGFTIGSMTLGLGPFTNFAANVHVAYPYIRFRRL